MQDRYVEWGGSLYDNGKASVLCAIECQSRVVNCTLADYHLEQPRQRFRPLFQKMERLAGDLEGCSGS